MPQIKVQDLYDTVTTESIADSGDVDFSVGVAPTYDKGWIVVEAENALKRDLMYYHDVDGTRIYVKSINRPFPKSHTSGVSVKMLDVAAIFNYFSDMVSQLFFTEKAGGLVVNVFGGYTSYNGNTVSVADTTLTLADNATNYIKYDYPTNVISSSTSSTGNVKVVVTTVSGQVTNIEYRNAKESYIDFTVAITGALPNQATHAGHVLHTDGTNVYWAEIQHIKATNVLLGEVKIASQTEIDAETDNDGSGTSFVTTPSQITGVKSIVDPQYESYLVAGDLVGQTPDGLYKVTTEVKTSTAVGGTNTILSQCAVGNNIYAFLYISSGIAYVRAGSLNPSTDVMTYGTAVSLGSLSSGTGRIALVDTNKIVCAFTDASTGASRTVSSVVGTLSGTSISLGVTYTDTVTMTAGFQMFLDSAFKVRASVYGYTVRCSNATSFSVRLNNISGTTISAGTSIATYGATQNGVRGVYLADNVIAVSQTNDSTPNTQVRIYTINPASTAILVTYTATTSTVNTGLLICRYSATEVLVTNGANTSCTICGIPAAGITLDQTALTANAGNGYTPIALFNGIVGIFNNTSTLSIKQKDVVIGTITSTPSFPAMDPIYNSGRLVCFTGTTLVSNIVNLARTFLIGVATNNTGKFVPGRPYNVKTGILQGYRYYLQSNGALSAGLGDTTTGTQTSFFGRGVGTAKILIEI